MRPLLLDPVLVPKPWGGRRLADLGADLPDDGTWGEAWVVADLDPKDTPQPDPASRVRTGPHTGRTLTDLVASHGEELLGTATATGGRFPLLVKTLDARQHLSVQVHPPAALLGAHPTARLKTESWVVVAADEGSVLYLGLADDATPDQVRDALGTAALVPLLRPVPAQVGDVVHVPAGLVHALGAGVAVAEVQTPSDTTWRLWDWTDRYDRPTRDLHVGPGWEAIAATWDTNVSPPPTTAADGRLVTTDHYTIDRQRVDADDVVYGLDGRVTVVMMLDAHLDVDGTSIGPGEVVLLPAVTEGHPVATTAGDVLVVTPG